MREIRENKSKEIITQSKMNQQASGIKLSDRAKSQNIPNPVKGLSLSLYSMNKEH